MNILNHLTSLKAFEAAARLGSFKAAAKELNVSEGAISRQIKNLEAAIGATLFSRGHRHVALTDDGLALANGTIVAFQQLRETGAKLADRHKSDVMVIGAPSSFLLRWLVPRIGDLQKKLRKTRVQVTAWDVGQPNPAPAQTICIRVETPDPSPENISKPFMAEEFGLVINPSLIEGRHPISLEDIRKVPRLYSRTRPLMWDQWLAESSTPDSPAEYMEFEKLFFAIEAAEAGFGCTIAPRMLVVDAIRAGRLVAPFGFTKRSGAYYAVAARTAANQHNIQKCIRWLAEECQSSLRASFHPQNT